MSGATLDLARTNPRPGPSAIVTNPELAPLDPGSVEDFKYVLRSEGALTCVTIAAEVINRTHVSPTNFRRLLWESVPEARVRSFNPGAESNETKEKKRDYVLL